jgi:hypothetical protein
MYISRPHCRQKNSLTIQAVYCIKPINRNSTSVNKRTQLRYREDLMALPGCDFISNLSSAIHKS